jgi:hypothetical protein
MGAPQVASLSRIGPRSLTGGPGDVAGGWLDLYRLPLDAHVSNGRGENAPPLITRREPRGRPAGVDQGEGQRLAVIQLLAQEIPGILPVNPEDCARLGS